MKKCGWNFARFFLLVLISSGCLRNPDPWDPKTYPEEVRPYLVDTGALDKKWKKYEIVGEEGRSFFFAREERWAVIAVSFTCGKYQDVALHQLADHLLIPMGKNPKVLAAEYVEWERAELFHLKARGNYCYQKEAVYKDLGHVPRESAEIILEAYVIGEPHCVVDVVFVAEPPAYPEYLADFHAYVESLGIPVVEE